MGSPWGTVSVVERDGVYEQLRYWMLFTNVDGVSTVGCPTSYDRGDGLENFLFGVTVKL